MGSSPFLKWSVVKPPIGQTRTDDANQHIVGVTPQPGVLVMALSKGGVPGSIRIYAVAPDGKSMIERDRFQSRRQPVMRTNYFNRVR